MCGNECDLAVVNLLRQADRAVIERFGAAEVLRALANSLEDGRWPDDISIAEVGTAVARAVATISNPGFELYSFLEGYRANSYGYPSPEWNGDDDWQPHDRW